MKESPSIYFKTQLDNFYDDLASKRILTAKVEKSKGTITYTTDSNEKHTVNIQMNTFMSTAIIDEMIDNDVLITFDDKQNQISYIFLQNGISLIFLGIMIYVVFIQRSSTQNKFFNSSKKSINPESINVNFNDVAGLENAKIELKEIVDFLKNPEKFSRVGAKIPKGCLLTGGPGLGKTLLAKAVAGEAGVPFFACSASEFIELFVGVGASRVRDLFKKANSSSPCIIFIDEIDAIGKSRASGGMTGSNDERDQTINQLLTEMDGFETNTGIVVIAATNRPDILDKALVRPGRFDRQIVLDAPTLNDRDQILQIHCRGKPLAQDVVLLDVAKVTVGLSGAELANIANEAAILAARKGSETITMDDFMNAIDRVLLGPEKTNSLISEKKKRIVAAHEAGHTVVAMKVGEYDKISKVTIIPRGKTGGVTMFEPSIENLDSGLFSRKYIENRLIVALGGRAAEDIVFGESNITTGAYNDMEIVQQLARSMVINYGFSDKLGPVSWESKGNMFTNEFSPMTMNKIDKEVIDIVKQSYIKAKNIINNNFNLFNDIAEGLYHKEVLTKVDIETLSKQNI
jgi:cell division protease FtsH